MLEKKSFDSVKKIFQNFFNNLLKNDQYLIKFESLRAKNIKYYAVLL